MPYQGIQNLSQGKGEEKDLIRRMKYLDMHFRKITLAECAETTGRRWRTNSEAVAVKQARDAGGHRSGWV